MTNEKPYAVAVVMLLNRETGEEVGHLCYPATRVLLIDATDIGPELQAKILKNEGTAYKVDYSGCWVMPRQ